MEIDSSNDLMLTPTKTKEYHDKPIVSTPDTVASFSSSLFHSPTVRIEHTVKETQESNDPEGSGFCYTIIKTLMKKEGKLIAMLLTYSILSTVGGSMIFTRYTTLNTSMDLDPILDNLDVDVDNFRTENMKLKSELDTMIDEIDRLTNESTVLREESEFFKQLSSQLSHNLTDSIKTNQNMNARIEELDVYMNETIIHFQDIIDDMNVQNNELEENIDQLQSQNSGLHAEIENLENINSNLTTTLNEKILINGNLDEEVNNLAEEKSLLKTDIEELQISLQQLIHENSQFKSHNEDLMSLVSFLNTIESELEGSILNITSDLADLINSYRFLAVRDLEIQYKTIIERWPCKLERLYDGELFVVDPSLSIAGFYDAVMNFVDNSVLIEICADLDDFEKFMLGNVDVNDKSSISLTTLLDSLTTYTSLVHDYYFSNSSIPFEFSLSALDWEAANFHCEELPLESKYSFF